MKKATLIIGLLFASFAMMAGTPTKPYVIVDGKIQFCDKLVEQTSGFKLKFSDKESMKLSLNEVDEFYNNGKYFQRFSIDEEGIDNEFMEVVAVKGNLRLVKYSYYEPTMMDIESSAVVPGGEFSTLYLFDKDNFLIEVYDEIADNIQIYFSE